MMRTNKRIKHNVLALTDFPSCSPMIYKGRSYILCAKLEIGYFALTSGRLVFLPAEQEGITYKVYHEWSEP